MTRPHSHWDIIGDRLPLRKYYKYCNRIILKREPASVGRNPDAGRLFCLRKKILTIIINMTYRCRVCFDMILTEREIKEAEDASNVYLV